MANSFTVPAPMLRRMLTAVLPHIGLDEELPALTNVRFEVRGGTLFAEATDRYTMGVARCGAGGEPGAQQAMLPRKSAKALRKVLRDAEGRVTITLEPGLMRAEIDGLTAAEWKTDTRDYSGTSWDDLMHRMVAGTPAAFEDRFGLDAAKLGRFAIKGPWLEPLLVRVLLPLRRDGATPPGDASPVLLVTRGDWFLGALMPVRVPVPKDAEATWNEWVKTTAPAEKTEAA